MGKLILEILLHINNMNGTAFYNHTIAEFGIIANFLTLIKIKTRTTSFSFFNGLKRRSAIFSIMKKKGKIEG